MYLNQFLAVNLCIAGKIHYIIDICYDWEYNHITEVTSLGRDLRPALDRKDGRRMKKEEFALRLKHACDKVTAAEDMLTEIDSKFGDADHGLTMAKIAGAIAQAVEEAEGGIQSMLDDAAMAVMVLNGGSAVPLWNTWLDGLQEAAPEGDEVSTGELQTMFAHALEALSDISGAKVGDKTMMDALIPASQAIAAYSGDEAGLFAAAAQAAQNGAEESKKFVSKFGRAKSYGEKTIGTPDAGAVSMACFFQGLAEG